MALRNVVVVLDENNPNDKQLCEETSLHANVSAMRNEEQSVSSNCHTLAHEKNEKKSEMTWKEWQLRRSNFLRVYERQTCEMTGEKITVTSRGRERSPLSRIRLSNLSAPHCPLFWAARCFLIDWFVIASAFALQVALKETPSTLGRSSAVKHSKQQQTHQFINKSR